MKTVDVRFGTRVYRLEVLKDLGDGTLATVRQNGLQAFCYPDGRADIILRDPRSDVLLSEGMGSWHESTGEQPANGPRIRIKRGSKIWSTANQRYRVIDHEITTYAEEDDEDLSYRFTYDGQTWTIGMEEI